MSETSPLKHKCLKTACALSLAMNAAVFALIFTPLTNWMYARIEVQPAIEKADAIVLLAAGNYTPEIFSGDAYQRMHHAFDLHKHGYADKIIICGGILSEGALPISVMMKTFLVKMGVDKGKIVTEDSSQNTYENIKNALPILESMGVRKPILVTSSYHMFRSLGVCRKLGLSVYPAPVPCYEKTLSDFGHRSRTIPNILREYCALIYFRLAGWI